MKPTLTLDIGLSGILTEDGRPETTAGLAAIVGKKGARLYDRASLGVRVRLALSQSYDSVTIPTMDRKCVDVRPTAGTCFDSRPPWGLGCSMAKGKGRCHQEAAARFAPQAPRESIVSHCCGRFSVVLFHNDIVSGNESSLDPPSY